MQPTAFKRIVIYRVHAYNKVMAPEKIKLILKLLSAAACLPVIIILTMRNYRVDTEYTIASFALSLLLAGLLLATFLFSAKFKAVWEGGSTLEKILHIAAALFLVPGTIIITMLVLLIIGLSAGILHITM